MGEKGRQTQTTSRSPRLDKLSRRSRSLRVNDTYLPLLTSSAEEEVEQKNDDIYVD